MGIAKGFRSAIEGCTSNIPAICMQVECLNDLAHAHVGSTTSCMNHQSSN